MGTMKRSLYGAAVIGLLCASMVGAPSGVSAQPAEPLLGSDIPAAIVTFPLVRVDSGVDTFIQMANTDPANVHAAQCFYINAEGTCSVSGDPCLVRFDCPGALSGEVCNPAWVESNFFIDFTGNQPLGWQASVGLSFLPCDPTFIGSGSQASCGVNNQTNGHGGVTAAQAPFEGFLTCIGVNGIDDVTPNAANVFIGNATVITSDGVNALPLDTYTYNGIGIQADEANLNGDNFLCLGTDNGPDCPAAEYAGCPQTLILNHYFDDSQNDTKTRLTLIPCTQLETPRGAGFPSPDIVGTTVQFLVFNEFEQKTSASTRFSCFADLQLSDLDTRPSFPGDNGNSIFNVAVQGTIGGQTRIRGVAGTEPDVGHGLLGVAVQQVDLDMMGPTSAAVNLNFQGTRSQADVICKNPGPCAPTVGP